MCLFRVGCVMLSFGAVVWNIYLFRLDEDSVEIKVKEMPSKDYVFYSSITLCFRRKINNWNKVFIGHPSSKDQLQDKSDRRIFHIDDYIDNIVLKYKNENRERITKTVSNITLNNICFFKKSGDIKFLCHLIQSCNLFLYILFSFTTISSLIFRSSFKKFSVAIF